MLGSGLTLMDMSGGAGAGAPALPAQAALVTHWSADSIAPQTDNTALTVPWVDVVNGAQADPSLAAIKPKYRTAAFPGGKPCVEFTGTTCWLEVLRTQATALVAVMDSSNYTMIAIIDAIGVKANGWVFGANTTGLNGAYMIADGTRVGVYSGSGNVVTTVPFTTAANGVAIIMRACYAGAKAGGVGYSRAGVNGSIFQTSLGVPPTTGGFNIGIGGRQGTGAGGALFKMRRLMIWNRELTPAEFKQVVRFDAADRGLVPPWTLNPTQRFVIFPGDSITMGATSDAVEYTYPYRVAQSLGLAYGQWTNLGIGGISMAQMDAMRALDVDPIPALVGKPCIAAFFEAYNQGVAQATMVTISRAYGANLRAANPSMLQVFGTSTDAASPFTAYNAAFDADNSQFDGYVPIHTNVNIGVAGTNASSVYFAPDHIHLTGKSALPDGYSELAGMFTPAIASRLTI